MSDPTGWRPFTPTAQAVRIMASTDAANNMRLAVFLDQHRNAAAGYPDGRAWWGYVQRAANGADMPGLVGELMPVAVDSWIGAKQPKFYKGWQAPWYPDAKYINERLGELDGNHFEIDYTKMEADWKIAETEYYQRAINAAIAHSFPVPNLGGPLDYRVQAIVGRPPKSARIPAAAKTGHQWLLGFSTEKDELLERLLISAAGGFEMPSAEQIREREGESDRLRREVYEMRELMQQLMAKAGDNVILPSSGKPTKRVMSQAQKDALAKGRLGKGAKKGDLDFVPGGAR